MRAVAGKSRQAEIADKIIDADLRFIQHLLLEPGVDLPADSVVIHAYEPDPELSREALRVALANRQKVRSRRELAKPAVVVNEDRHGKFSVAVRDWDELALEYSLQHASRAGQKAASERKARK